MAATLLSSSATTPFLLRCPFPDRTQPNPIRVPFPDRTQPNPIRVPFRSAYKSSTRGSSSCVVRFGFQPGIFSDPEEASHRLKHLIERAEGLAYTIADAAVSNPDGVTAATKQDHRDWLSGITDSMESVLKILKDGLSALHVPYSYGFAIILLTILVKAITFPLSKKQVESAMAMRSMQPQVKAIQERYAGNQEKIQLETARLYKLAGVNPFAGCLPTIATIPVWIGLYRALSNVANEGLLTEGFFWIPSLAGPTAIADRQGGSGISWLFPFVDGHPPLGWPNTLAYLVLPVLLVVSQYISIQILQASQSSDPNVKNSQAITQFLPLLIGYFALSVPSGLSLYWFTNNVLSSAQQIWLQKLGGAKTPVIQFNDDILKDQVRSSKSASQLIDTKEVADQVERSGQSTYTKPQTKQVEGPASGGMRPGERFKQIKEEEARRKRQREEEEMKSKQIEANGSGKQLENGGLLEKPHSEQDAVEVNGSVTRTDDKLSVEGRVEVQSE